MYDVIDLYQTNPNSKGINLQLKNIKDITQMVNVFAKFKNLQQIYLHGNKLHSIPPMQNLKFLRLLDLSNNPIKIDKYLLDRLYQLPRLQHLCITATRQETKIIIQNLPKLKILNDEPIQRQIFVKQTLQQQLDGLQLKLTEQMKRIQQTYSRLANSLEGIGKQRGLGNTNKQQFNFLYKDVQEEMTYFYSGLQDKLSREGVFAYCKNKLTIVLDNLMIRILDEVSNESVVKIYQEISKIKNQNFDLLLKVIFSACYENYVNEEVDKPTNRLRKETLYQNQIFRLKKQTMEKMKENNQIQKLLEKENKLIQNMKIPTPKSGRKTQRFSKSPSTGYLPKKSPNKSLSKVQTSKQPLIITHSQSIKKLPQTLNNNTNAKKSISPVKVISHTPSKANLNTGGCRIVSLEQLLSVIQEIMAQKNRYNLRNFEKKEDYETAQEFIFTFFSRKYGLRELALDWSLSVIKAIQIYCKQSIEVQIFGKILKSTLYEQYYEECRCFGQQIQKVYKQSRIDKGMLTQNQFKKIFFYLFSYQNQQTFQKILKTFKFPLSLQQMTYFLQSYKLAFQQKQLKKFIDIFIRLDQNDDSALTSKQFKQLIIRLLNDNQSMGDKQKQLRREELIAQVQVMRKNKFIFSEVFQIVHLIV